MSTIAILDQTRENHDNCESNAKSYYNSIALARTQDLKVGYCHVESSRSCSNLRDERRTRERKRNGKILVYDLPAKNETKSASIFQDLITDLQIMEADTYLASLISTVSNRPTMMSARCETLKDGMVFKGKRGADRQSIPFKRMGACFQTAPYLSLHRKAEINL